MKRLTRTMSIFLVCGFLGMNTPVMAQQDNSARTTQDAGDDDDNGQWGLAGLLGLLGLLGLRKRDDDDRRRTGVNR